MKRITISLPEDLAAILTDDARRRRRSVSELVREAVEKELGVHPECSPRKLPFENIVSSGSMVRGADVDEYLAEHWQRDLRESERDR